MLLRYHDWVAEFLDNDAAHVKMMTFHEERQSPKLTHLRTTRRSFGATEHAESTEKSPKHPLFGVALCGHCVLCGLRLWRV